MAKSKYETNVLPRLNDISKWATDGLSEKQIAKNLGIAYLTFNVYKEKYAELLEVLTRAKIVPDTEVENALYKKCLGYNAKVIKHYKIKTVEYDSETGKRLHEVEKLVPVEDEVHVPADTTAQMFWLANRQPKRWSYKPNAEEDPDEDNTGVVVLPEIMEGENGADSKVNNLEASAASD